MLTKTTFQNASTGPTRTKMLGAAELSLLVTVAIILSKEIIVFTLFS